MKKSFLAIFLTILVAVSLSSLGILLIFLAEDEAPTGKIYSFPILVREKTFVVTVESNYTSAPEVSYSGIGKSVSVDFWGEKEQAFCNITIPSDLVWGELTVIDKYYKMSEDRYIQSHNSTHNSIYFTFNHTATTKHFEVVGTEGIIG